METSKNIVDILGDKAPYYLDHVCEKITKDELQTPSDHSSYLLVPFSQRYIFR